MVYLRHALMFQWVLVLSILGHLQALRHFGTSLDRHILENDLSKRKLTSRVIELDEEAFDGLDQLRRCIDSVVVPANTTATLLNMILLGDKFAKDQDTDTSVCTDITDSTNDTGGTKLSYHKSIQGKNWQCVPGCMADARVWTTVSTYMRDFRKL